MKAFLWSVGKCAVKAGNLLTLGWVGRYMQRRGARMVREALAGMTEEQLRDVAEEYPWLFDRVASMHGPAYVEQGMAREFQRIERTKGVA